MSKPRYCKSCGKLLPYDETRPGRPPEYCNETHRQRGYRKARAYQNTDKDEDELVSGRTAVQQKTVHRNAPPRSSSATPSTTHHSVSDPPIIYMLGHRLISRKTCYTCRICGWSWSDFPENSCPGRRMYSQNDKPAHLLTLEQVKQEGLHPEDFPSCMLPYPDAFLYRPDKETGREPLYDIRKALPRL